MLRVMEDGLLIVLRDGYLVAAIIFANYVLAVVCAVREIMISRTAQGSIAWLLSLALLPFPTTILYLMFGWKLFDDYATVESQRGRNARRARADDRVFLDDTANREWQVLSAVSELPFHCGNEAELLVDGEASFRSMFEGISRATETVYTQFYIIRDDRLGREFADCLIERARAGVAVYLIYDDVGSFWLPRDYRRRLEAAGVHVATFNQQHRSLRLYGPSRINYRNHRKVVVVDAREAWVGGLNVGVEYLGEVARFGRWRDTSVRVLGPAALSCAQTFREDWQWATGELLPVPSIESIPSGGEQSVLVMPTGPADELEECAIGFSEVIARARRRLWIVSPYFVPDVDMQTALLAAALRGVDVRVLIPEKPDHFLVWMASNAHAARMIDFGVDVFRYSDGFLHQKVVLMDDAIASVGTVNFDNRSFNINFELTLWFTHRKMIADVERMLEEDFAASAPFTPEVRDAQPFWFKFLGQGAKLLSPLL